MEGRRARSVAWSDAKAWIFKPREIVPLGVTGLLTLGGVALWGHGGGLFAALMALAAVGAAAILIPGVVWLASVVSAPHRLLRERVRTLEAAAAVPVVPSRSEVLSRLGAMLTEGTKRLDLLAVTVNPKAQEAAWEWEVKAQRALGDLLGSHESALFGSAPSVIPPRDPEPIAEDGFTWSWQQMDIKVRWLRQRIEELRDSEG